MYIRVLTLLTILSVVVHHTTRSQTNQRLQKGINFQNSAGWQEVLDLAKNKQKYIFLDIYTTWCVPCKKMDIQVYSNDTVGSYMNDNFICVKVQIDTSTADSELIKEWYKDARMIAEKYKVSAYPTLLYLSSEGRLEYKSVGYHSPKQLIDASRSALSSNYGYYYAELENYKKGNKNYDSIKNLSRFARNILGEDSLGLEIARDAINHPGFLVSPTVDDIFFVREEANNIKLSDSMAIIYKTKHLEVVPDSLLTRKDIFFFNIYNKLLTSKDRVFILSYSDPSFITKIAGDTVWPNFFVETVVMREEIANRLIKNNKPLYKEPDWVSIQHEINKKYPVVDADLMVLRYKTHYYRNVDVNWAKWAAYKDSLITLFPPKNTSDADFFLNGPAWNTFQYCNDNAVLKTALMWIDKALKEFGENGSWLDTKANLLYKIGFHSSALKFQKKAISFLDPLANDPDTQEVRDHYEKMKKKIPTWK